MTPRAELTPREAEVLELLLTASTPAQIAERLALSTHTIDNLLRRLRGRYHTTTTAALVAVVLGGRLATAEAELARCRRDLAAVDRRGRERLE